MKLRIGTLALFLTVCGIALGESVADFAKANREYAGNDFKAAIGDYEQLVKSSVRTANLFYNLGNAYFRDKDFGRAILNYERALALDPRHPEAQANLRIARDEGRALELIPSKWERLFVLATRNQYAIAGAIAFWIFLFCVAGTIFARRRSGAIVAFSILSLSISAFSIVGLMQLNRGRAGESFAVVTADNVEARLATADTANRVLTLPAGSEIEILSRRGDWIYATLPNNLRGWMPASSAEQVRF
jgi:tetratricopeptide (TPR) repeat protein